VDWGVYCVARQVLPRGRGSEEHGCAWRGGGVKLRTEAGARVGRAEGGLSRERAALMFNESLATAGGRLGGAE